MELERKIGFCIDCNLFRILDRASEDLEIIRSERKRNMENLDSLLKGVAAQIFQAGGIDKPLITQRRSRMCVGVRASHKYLVPDGVILNVSSSGATYFMEPREAVELNNLDVRLSDSERIEEITILSLLTSEVAESEEEMKYMLDRVLEVDLAFARAAYAHWIKGVCPTLTAVSREDSNTTGSDHSLSVDIEGIQHPLLLGLSLSNSSDAMTSNYDVSAEFNAENSLTTSGNTTEIVSDFPVPIDFKVRRGTSVIVISGPNTGGKTVSMKTLGLASLMSKAGMYLPAKKHPRLPWFDLVLADIGDPQSLEQNLSTFSGHMLWICKILEVASKETLVLIDEIGTGTDPSEGVALSTSILQYLKDHVNLAIVTTHFSDLSCLKDKDKRFENAAMEFCHETLLPTYRILWGSIGDSNALSIAKSFGFDTKIIDRAKNWVERLSPENQQERKGQLYQSLLEERKKLEVQVQKAASLHEEIMDLYYEIQKEADDLDSREIALTAKETQLVQQELNTAKSQLEIVVHEFEDQLRTANAGQLNSLIGKSESAIASIVEAHCPRDNFPATETNVTYAPQVGEQVYVKGLGDKLATVVKAPEDEETVLVQYGKIKVRVKKSHIRAIPRSESSNATRSALHLKRRVQLRQKFQSTSEAKGGGDVYGPRVQTSKNTVDLRGMRVEEAALQLNIALTSRESHSVLFIIHGVGTGAVKGHALEILKSHPRVAKYEPESPMNYGCTVAYIK
ncbi:endonuclease MutS2 isoform X2 [Tripterygium wilfordii]|nr:endonuclease MutS2 isoform X2 [Tripterygium wilfordii]